MRILFVTNMYPHAENPGFGNFVREQAESLRSVGIHVDMMVIPAWKSKLHYLMAFFRIFAKTVITRYDIVHAHYGFCGVVAMCRWRTPVVTTFHGSEIYIAWQRRIVRIARFVSTATIYVSDKLRRTMADKKGIVIPCGIDLELFRPMERAVCREKLGLPEKVKIVLFPGKRGNPVKNHDLFERTIRLMDGDGIRMYELGNVRHEDVPIVINACDAILMTSVYEGAPIIIKEALACNVPVVSVDVGDVAAVTDGITGCFVSEPKPDTLASKVREALNYGRVDSRRKIKPYEIGAIAERLKRLYTVISCHKRTHGNGLSSKAE